MPIYQPLRNLIRNRINLIRPGSRCPQCGHRITALENIPLLGYLLLGGRCAGCDNRISLRYPLVETLTAVMTLSVAMKFGVSAQTLFACLFTWALISLTFIDIDHQLLPDTITLPFLWFGLLCNYFGLFTDLYSSLMGAAAGYGIFWLNLPDFQICHRKGRHGIGRSEAACHAGGMGGVAGIGVDNFSLFLARFPGRTLPGLISPPAKIIANPIRALPGCGRMAEPGVGIESF